MRLRSLFLVVVGLSLIAGCPGKSPNKPSGGNNGAAKRWVAFVPDAKDWVTKETLLLDAQQAIQQLVPKSLQVSANGEHYAYVMKEGADTVVVLDGKIQARFIERQFSEFIPAGPVNIAFSGDGQHFLCSGHEKARKQSFERYSCMYLDGRQVLSEENANTGEIVRRIWLNHDGSQVAYVSHNDVFIVDGKNVHSSYSWDDFVVTPAEKIGWFQGKSPTSVVFNGEEVAVPPEYKYLSISPNGQSFAVVASQENQQFAIVNGKQQKRFDEVLVPMDSYSRPVPPIVLFSGDGKHYALAARDGTTFCILHDNMRHELLGSPGLPLSLSPDGTRWATWVTKPETANTFDQRVCAVIDGETMMEYASVGDSVNAKGRPAVIFSPNSQQYAYAAVLIEEVKNRDGTMSRELHPAMVRDGSEQNRFGWVSGQPVFSPNNTHLAYSAADTLDGPRFMTVDGGKIGQAYETYHDEIAPSFSPDEKSLSYVVRAQGDWHAVLDGHERGGYDVIGPEQTRVGFTSDGDFTYLAIREGGIYWVEENRE